MRSSTVPSSTVSSTSAASTTKGPENARLWRPTKTKHWRYCRRNAGKFRFPGLFHNHQHRNSLLLLTHYLPEVWYIMLFAILAHSNIHILFNGGNWHSGNTFTTLFCVAIIALLIIQLLKRNVWSRFLLGMLFTFGSLFMFFALLSEYSEFPLGTEASALQLLVAGSLFIGISFLLGGKMLLNGLHNMYA